MTLAQRHQYRHQAQHVQGRAGQVEPLATPVGSSRWTNLRLRISATSEIGRLTQKIARQPNRPATRPPSGGPHELPNWTIMDCNPSTRPRCSPGKEWVKMAAELAQIAAEPKAVIARVPMKSVGVPPGCSARSQA